MRPALPCRPRNGSASSSRSIGCARKDHGAGLGLNLVRDLMLRHGKVEVLDGKAGGACFKMIFPPAPRD